MNKLIEFCPNCNGGREFDLSLGLITFNNPEENEDILLYHYHCASCNTYLRTTTVDYEEYIKPNEFAVVSVPEYI